MSPDILSRTRPLSLNGKTKAEIFDEALKDSRKRNQKIHETLLKIPNMSWDDVHTSGYVVDTLAASYWALLKSSSFKEALILAVNRGDDADTIGAVIVLIIKFSIMENDIMPCMPAAVYLKSKLRRVNWGPLWRLLWP